MKSSLPKVLHPVLGRPMVAHVAAAAAAGGVDRLVVVVGPEGDAVVKVVAPHRTVVQYDRLGTGHAAKQARAELEGVNGTVLVLCGDAPLLRPETIRTLIETREKTGAGVAVLGFEAADPGAYGRLILENGNDLTAIVEAKEATPEQLAIRWCNSGVLAIDGAALWGWLDRISNENAKGEYYLTDVVALARADARTCVMVPCPEEEVMGVNARAELAVCETVAQDRMRQQAMADGATLIDPKTTYFSWDTRLGRDVVVGPFTVFGPGVTIGDAVEIKGFCHFEGCTVAAGATLGPYARLRPQADIGEGAHIGNFVEIKKSTVEAGAKVNHLSYIGDAFVGSRSNIGAGTITCNYDGFDKAKTTIGAGAFIGSNSSLVAPVTVGAGAIVGAGSVITKNVEADALALVRADQTEKAGWAARFRTVKLASKAKK